MNKQDWTYKKLGEVCVDKKQIVRASNLFLPNEIINYIDISSIDNSQNAITSTTPIIFDDAPSRAQQVVNIGDVLISLVRPNLRNIAIVNSQNDNLVASSGFCILRTNGLVNNRYLFYIVRGDKFTNYLLSRVQGANYPAVREDDIKNYLLPVPPIGEQERIVAELDLLSGIIEKKKEQLKAYDQLAKSIFYSMFGDPIDNPKGWEIKKLKEVSTLINGRAYKQNELLSEGKYKVLRVGNFFTNSNFYYSDLELEDNKYCDNGDLLFAWSASFGAFIWNGGKVIFHYHIWKVLYDEQQLNKIFYRFLLNTMTNAFMNDVHGIGMVHLTKQGMEEYNIPIPPLSLQQEFAEKVEAIERQKALVQQSIEETQTMFDFTMDKYFG